MRLYLDTNALIFGVEGPAKVRDQVFGWIDRFEATSDGLAVTSRLSRLECRVKPMRLGDTAALARFDAVLDAGNLSIVEVSADVIERATEIRAQHGFRVPDALHMATAVLERADVFLTSDAKLKRFSNLAVELLQL